MKVKRIVANLACPAPDAARRFYQEVLGLEVLMDHGWLAAYGNHESMTVQLAIASEGGNGTSVPDLSIEVDDLEEALQRIQAAGIPLEYGPAVEAWGVRRFFIRDPLGKLLNILVHI